VEYFFIMKNNTIRKLLNGLSGRTGAAMLAMGVVGCAQSDSVDYFSQYQYFCAGDGQFS
jgi:hypothetical protein